MKPINKPWLGIDPRNKLLIGLLFSIISILSDGITTQATLCGVSLLFCLLAGLCLRHALRRCLLVNVFLAFIWLALPWRLQPLDGQWVFSFQTEGLWLALAITLKANAIFMAWMGLLWDLGLNQILQALTSWKLSPKLLALFFLFCRFTWLIKEEFTLMRQAMLCRGFKLKLNGHSLRSLAQLIAAILVRSLDRSEKIYQAMLCRGYCGKFYFSHSPRWQKRDSLMLMVILFTAILGGLAVCRDMML